MAKSVLDEVLGFTKKLQKGAGYVVGQAKTNLVNPFQNRPIVGGVVGRAIQNVKPMATNIVKTVARQPIVSPQFAPFIKSNVGDVARKVAGTVYQPKVGIFPNLQRTAYEFNQVGNGPITPQQVSTMANMVGFVAPQSKVISKVLPATFRKQFKSLAVEARKYKSAEEFSNIVNPKDNLSRMFQDIQSKLQKPIKVPTERAFHDFLRKADPQRYQRIVKNEIESKRLIKIINDIRSKKAGVDMSGSFSADLYEKELQNFYNQAKGISSKNLRTPNIAIQEEAVLPKGIKSQKGYKTPIPSETRVQQRQSILEMNRKTSSGNFIPPKALNQPPKARGGISSPGINFKIVRDRSALTLSRETMERNLERVFPEQSSKLKGFMVEPTRLNETNRIIYTNNLRDEIEESIIKRFNIKPGSREDALIQHFGEGKITLEELQKQTPKWQEVRVSAKYFRDKYDELLDHVNQVRKDFGYDPIPKRQNYFRHFQELGGLIDDFGLIFKQENLPTEISGLTEFFTPGKPFSTAELQRKGGKYTESAIKGMDNYLDSITRQIFHIDSVQRARALEKYIRQSAQKGQVQLPNFVANLKEYGNLLSGKKAQFDRAFEGVFGRPFYVGMNFLRQRTSANMIGANISSALTNYIPLTQFMATTPKQYVVRGIFDGMISPFRNFFEIGGVRSGLLTRRFPKESISKTFVQKGATKANWLFKTIDQFTSRAIVSGKYYENLANGLSSKQAMLEADKYASRAIADRSIGQLPNLFGTRTLGPITQFQTEVNNMWSFMRRDIPQFEKGNKTKILGALGQFFIYSHIFNNLYEKVTGRRPTIDPIQAVLTLAGKSPEGEGKPFGERVLVAGKDIGENLPFSGLIAGGGRFPISAGIPNVPALLKGETTLGKEITKPLSYILPPFGGGQLKKTYEGISDYIKGYSTSPKGRVRYPIEQTPQNLIRGSLFGKYSFPEAGEYFKKRAGETLGDIQSAKVRAGDIGEAYKRQALEAYMKGDYKKAGELQSKFNIKVSKKDLSFIKDKAIDYYFEGNYKKAGEIQKNTGLRIKKSDIQKEAKRKAIEAYRRGDYKTAGKLQRQFKLRVSRKDIGIENGSSSKKIQDIPSLINRYFPRPQIENAYAVMNGESSGDPKAININTNGSKDYGLFQINDIHAPWIKRIFGWDMDDLLDPEKNIQVAVYLMKQQGWTPWVAAQKLGIR